MKYIIKKKNTYYANFTNSQGDRVRSSLGKNLNLAIAKVEQMLSGTPELHVEEQTHSL